MPLTRTIAFLWARLGRGRRKPVEGRNLHEKITIRAREVRGLANRIGLSVPAQRYNPSGIDLDTEGLMLQDLKPHDISEATTSSPLGSSGPSAVDYLRAYSSR